MGNSIVKKIPDEKSALRALPLFSGMDDAFLEKITAAAQVRDYKKGKLLFLEN